MDEEKDKKDKGAPASSMDVAPSADQSAREDGTAAAAVLAELEAEQSETTAAPETEKIVAPESRAAPDTSAMTAALSDLATPNEDSEAEEPETPDIKPTEEASPPEKQGTDSSSQTAGVVAVAGAAALSNGAKPDARIEARERIETAKTTPQVDALRPRPGEEPIIDPRTPASASKTMRSRERQKRDDGAGAWFWGAPLILAAGIMGLVAMPPWEPRNAQEILAETTVAPTELPVVASVSSVRPAPTEPVTGSAAQPPETMPAPPPTESNPERAPSQPEAENVRTETVAPQPTPPASPEPLSEDRVATAGNTTDTSPKTPSEKPVIAETSTTAVEKPATPSSAPPTPTVRTASLESTSTPRPKPRPPAPAATRVENTAPSGRNGAAITVPKRVYPADIVPGSAAAIVIETIESTGETLSLTQKQALALDVEASLDSEIDGRVVGLSSPQGQTVQLRPVYSLIAERSVQLERASDVAPVGASTRVEGGWYAVRSETPLRPVTHLSTLFKGPELSRGVMAERLATVTDFHGQRWFLVGQSGKGLGYVAAADVTPVDTFTGASTGVLSRDVNTMERETVAITTTCRLVSIRLLDVSEISSPSKTVSVCRQTDGRWLEEPPIGPSRSTAPITARTPPAGGLSARLWNDVGTVGARPSGLGTPEAFRVEFNSRLAAAPDGLPLNFALPGGQQATILPMFSRTVDRTVTLERAAELGGLAPGLELTGGWVETLRDDEIRPRPSLTTGLTNGRIEKGALLTEIARLTDGSGLNWSLVGNDGVAFGYIPRRDLLSVPANPELRFQAHRRVHGRIVRDLVEARVRCRDLEISGDSLVSQSLTVCQSSRGDWIIESSGNALAAAPGSLVFEQLFQ